MWLLKNFLRKFQQNCCKCCFVSVLVQTNTVSASPVWVPPKQRLRSLRLHVLIARARVSPVFTHGSPFFTKVVLPALLSHFLSRLRERNSREVGLIYRARVMSCWLSARTLHYPCSASSCQCVYALDSTPSSAASRLVPFDTSEEEVAVDNSMSLTASDAEKWVCYGEKPKAPSLYQSAQPSVDSVLIHILTRAFELRQNTS